MCSVPEQYSAHRPPHPLKACRSPCHVVYTDFRPTPLQHYIFPAGADGMHMVVDEKSVFREDNFSKAVAAVTEHSPAAKAGERQRKKGGQGRAAQEQESDIFKIVRMIMERGYDPVSSHCQPAAS